MLTQTDLFYTEQQEYYAHPDYLTSITESLDDDYLDYIRDRHLGRPSGKTILSLFDYTGNWSRPYAEAGYELFQLDLKFGHDINDFSVDYLCNELGIGEVYGILAGVPCTEFAVSGARWFDAKDKDGRTAQAVELVNQTLRTVEFFNPYFWVIENPVGRIPRLIPELNVKPWYFHPCDYGRGFEGEDYTKKTGLWGKFTPPTTQNLGADWSVHPAQGSKIHRLYGGNSEYTKTMRSVTPRGFSQAFFECNH